MKKFLLFTAVAATMLLTAGQASAASIIDLKTVSITNDGSTGFGATELADLRTAVGSAAGVTTQLNILPTAFGGSIANWTAELFTGTLNVATTGDYTFDLTPYNSTIGGYIKIDGRAISTATISGSGNSNGASTSSLTQGAHTFEAFLVKKGGNASTFTGFATGTNASSLSFSPLASAVPEPATWGMLILGFGLVGAASRYRRKRTTVAFA